MRTALIRAVPIISLHQSSTLKNMWVISYRVSSPCLAILQPGKPDGPLDMVCVNHVDIEIEQVFRRSFLSSLKVQFVHTQPCYNIMSLLVCFMWSYTWP